MTSSYLLKLSMILAFLCGAASAQNLKRCDLLLNHSPAPDTSLACMELVDSAGIPVLQTTLNATRIANVLTICKDAFNVTTSSEANIVFIMGNTGSMEYGDTRFCTYPGDSTFSRAKVVKYEMDLEQALAIKAAAGFISFNGGDTSGIQSSRLQPLLDISTSNPLSAVNLNILKSKAIPDTGVRPSSSCNSSVMTNVDWEPSFKLALEWFNDTTLSESPNHAIILVSDGAVDDYAMVQGMIGQLPPVYGIDLGKPLNNQGQPNQAAAQLQQLSQLTGGQYYRITPNDSLDMRRVMDTIASKLVKRAVAPVSFQIRNTVSNQTSVGLAMIPASDGNLNIVLDSILTLQKGSNSFETSINLGDNKVHPPYPFQVQADDADATQSSTGLACYDPSFLAMLNASGQQERAYSGSDKAFTLQLTRAPAELTTTTVKAVSTDLLQAQSWDDAESISLPLLSSSTTAAVNQTLTPYPFNSRALSPIPGNGILESDLSGRITLHWAHPRDPRDTALFNLPGAGNTMAVDRLLDVFHGANFNAGNLNPVVINKGVAYQRNGSSVVITNKGYCVYNCPSGQNGVDPITTPSFVVNADRPFKFNLYLYDNLGQFINKAADSINTATWQAFPASDSAVISVLPMTQKGRQIATGVYFLRATITTLPNAEVPVTTEILKQFGYVRP